MNNLSKLNDTLFAQLERLNTVKGGEDLTVEIDRSKAVSQVARDIISNAKLALDAETFRVEYSHTRVSLPAVLSTESKK